MGSKSQIISFEFIFSFLLGTDHISFYLPPNMFSLPKSQHIPTDIPNLFNCLLSQPQTPYALNCMLIFFLSLFQHRFFGIYTLILLNHSQILPIPDGSETLLFLSWQFNTYLVNQAPPKYLPLSFFLLKIRFQNHSERNT